MTAFEHLEPLPVPRPWGGRRIARRFGWDDSVPVGEWWLASTYPGATTRVRSTGEDLTDWLDRVGREHGCPSGADFPVLLKFLDAQDVLSVQVHPDDEVARRHGMPRGKTEAWHVLEAAPDAHVYLGPAPGRTSAEILDRAPDASREEMRELLRSVPVGAGDTLAVPAGTIHAIDEGLVLFEVQQTSDATYRIYDWDRGRPVHLDDAREAAHDLPAEQPSRREPADDTWTPLLDERAFRLLRGGVKQRLAFAPSRRFGLLTALAGSGSIRAGDASADFVAGETVLVLGEVELVGDGLDVLATEPPAV